MFSCQKCRTPLRFESESLPSESAVNALLGSLSNPTASSSASARSNTTYNQNALRDALMESFIYIASTSASSPSNLPNSSSLSALSSYSSNPNVSNASLPHTRSQSSLNGIHPTSPHAANVHVPPTANDKFITTMTELFDMASDRSSIDHPLCTGCAERVTGILESQLKEKQQERDLYRQSIEKLKTQFAQINAESSHGSASESDDDDSAFEAEERRLLGKLHSLSKQREDLENEWEVIQKEEAISKQFESLFWMIYLTHEHDFHSFNKEKQTIESRIQTIEEQLFVLQSINLLDDVFHISVDGHFGTINGFRLGRLSLHTIEWNEINAALGSVCLAVQTIARLLNYKFTRYRLFPLGSYSRIARIDDSLTAAASAPTPSATNACELYGSGDLLIGKIFWYRRFDTALVYLLQCIKELAEYLAVHIDEGKEFRLKYPIRGENIGDLCIKLQFNGDEKWTKACRYLLIDLKQVLVKTSEYLNQK